MRLFNLVSTEEIGEPSCNTVDIQFMNTNELSADQQKIRMNLFSAVQAKGVWTQWAITRIFHSVQSEWMSPNFHLSHRIHMWSHIDGPQQSH